MECTSCLRRFQQLYCIAGYEKLGPVCSKLCGEALYLIQVPLDEDEIVDLLQELEVILREKFLNCRYVNVNDPNCGARIREQLNEFGCCHVRFGGELTHSIRSTTGDLMVRTFPKSAPFAEQMRQGNFTAWYKWWKGNTLAVTEIWGKNPAMPLPLTLMRDARAPFTVKATATVHVKSLLTALNPIRTWETVCTQYPQMDPEVWLVKPVGSRINISEDGIKITEKRSYNPTALHYDAQFGVERQQDVESSRVQCVYSDDKGPVRLFVVPGSNGVRVQQIIRQLTGATMVGTFEEFAADFSVNHPQLYQLLHKYAVSLPYSGMQMFQPTVWHFEAKQDDIPLDGSGLVRPLLSDAGLYVADTSHDATSSSVSFRIYCGIVTLPASPVHIRDMIMFAYFREHGWVMDPFYEPHRKNRRGLFVNDKNNQAGMVSRRDYHENIEEFQRLKTTPLSVMKRWLREHVDARRLRFYGLTEDDLRVDVIVIDKRLVF